jgi:hypothetical protein
MHAYDLGEVRICEPVGTAKHGERDFSSGGLSFKPALSDAQDGSDFALPGLAFGLALAVRPGSARRGIRVLIEVARKTAPIVVA